MDRAALTELLAELRPSLHRYSARMTGSVIDGEDVVQSALARAIEAFATEPPVDNPAGWLFRITHNATLDFLRRRARERGLLSGEEAPAMTDDGPSATTALPQKRGLRWRRACAPSSGFRSRSGQASS